MSGPAFANLRRTPDRETAIKRRFWVAVALGVLISALDALHGSVGGHVYSGTWIAWLRWLELALAAIAAFWCGWPLLGPPSAHPPGGPALLALIGVAAFGYGLLALLAPELWPREWRDTFGMVPMRFELVAGATALALLWERLRTRGPAPVSK